MKMIKNKLFIYNLKQAYFFIREGVNPIGIGRHSKTKKFYFVFDKKQVEEGNLMKKWINGGDVRIFIVKYSEYALQIPEEEVVVIYNPFQAYFYIKNSLNPLEMVQLSNKKIAFIFNKRKSNPIFTKWLESKDIDG